MTVSVLLVTLHIPVVAPTIMFRGKESQIQSSKLICVRLQLFYSFPVQHLIFYDRFQAVLENLPITSRDLIVQDSKGAGAIIIGLCGIMHRHGSRYQDPYLVSALRK